MGKKILLIEDEPGLLLTLSDRLVSEGYDVETAADGEAGFHRAVDRVFDTATMETSGGISRRSVFRLAFPSRVQ